MWNKMTSLVLGLSAAVLLFSTTAHAAVTNTWNGPVNPVTGNNTYYFAVTNTDTTSATFQAFATCTDAAGLYYNYSTLCSSVTPGSVTSPVVVTVAPGSTANVSFTMNVVSTSQFYVRGFYKVNNQSRWLSRYILVTPSQSVKKVYIPILQK